MKGLIKGQRIFIDDHKRGVTHSCFDDPNADVHLDKESQTGKYRIRIPLNSKREIVVEERGKRRVGGQIPPDILSEIQEAFQDENKREVFVKWMVNELKNFPYSKPDREKGKLSSIDKAYAALRRVSEHFGLEWDNKTVRRFLKEYKSIGVRYMATVTSGADLYYLACEPHLFTIADYMATGIQDRRSWTELPYDDCLDVNSDHSNTE